MAVDAQTDGPRESIMALFTTVIIGRKKIVACTALQKVVRFTSNGKVIGCMNVIGAHMEKAFSGYPQGFH
jgi:hypothetical protein